MIDLTHTKRPEFIQLVLTIAVVFLALGAITPSALAVDYDDLKFSESDLTSVENVVTFYHSYNMTVSVPGAPTFPAGILYSDAHAEDGNGRFIVSFTAIGSPTDPALEMEIRQKLYDLGIISSVNADTSEVWFTYPGTKGVVAWIPKTFPYSYVVPPSFGLILSLQAFAPDDPSGMYVLSLDGSLLDTTYTVGINRYTDEFKYLIDSYAYTDGSGSYTFTGSRSLTLPIYYNSFTNMPYSYEVSINVNDENGYLDARYPVYWSDLGGLYDTVPGPLVPTPTPTQTFVPPGPVVPSDIIPDPEDLNNTVNFTGWYQDQGFEGNNITAPIYSGLRGWFSENMIPVFDFFLMPIGSLSSMISDSASTASDAIDDSVDQLSVYAAPMNMVGGYVVLLVPNVVWVVVFAALSIGYVVLLIRISTGSIRDTIGRFLGRW